MKVKLITIEIKIDDELIHGLYPHFEEEYATIEEFTEHIYESITTDDLDSLKSLGYSVKIVEPGNFNLN